MITLIPLTERQLLLWNDGSKQKMNLSAMTLVQEKTARDLWLKVSIIF